MAPAIPSKEHRPCFFGRSGETGPALCAGVRVFSLSEKDRAQAQNSIIDPHRCRSEHSATIRIPGSDQRSAVARAIDKAEEHIALAIAVYVVLKYAWAPGIVTGKDPLSNRICSGSPRKRLCCPRPP